MKIALAQINYHIGNFDSNVKKIRESIMKAKRGGADLVIFAELAISGYPPRDFLEFDDFIERCQRALDEIASDCEGIAAIVGAPAFNPEFQGKDLYNAAYFLNNGRVEKQINKTLLPNYDIFDEYRYFEPNKEFGIIEYKNKRISLTICEDLWNIGNNPMYTVNPMDELMKQKPDFIVNIAASPFHYDQAGQRKAILLQNVEKYKLPLFYVNHVGAQTELLFDGGSLAMSPRGFVVEELDYFNEDFRLIDLNKIEGAAKPEGTQKSEEKIILIRKALVMGIRNYFRKLGFDKAVLGLSGGIDSAVTLVIAAEALGAQNVYAVLLPSEFSSSHSVDDARQLAENLGCPYDLIPINDIYDSFMKSLKLQFRDLPFGIAEENIQARARGVLLMALSNKFGHILLNTSNKSEAAVGYGTLYGDMNGGLSVLGDVYKTQVFELARLINRGKEIIPENSIVKPPSAELRPDQKDSDSLPDYDVLDEILYQYIEMRKGPSDLIGMGFEESIVRKVLKLVNTSEYKRHQTPPILRVSPKAFGMGRRMPIVARYLS
ncbi:MAG: NAD+ synthase [Bacteroidales bacterium]|nr:NAD+ synthase [Bacteroidales bacterium]MCF8344920.1 NAD+ synthase [Bacteroidales bacterium]MCF8349713.1 NAD+ synthase [Bacteroidales bacterium]MCF8376686.1 NAD+ synthase [Bacteroidales bacterium]MCF8401769.1 NAD+ synthase [Bacteroidales bacterium]